MARETKAERMARIAQEQAEREAALVAAYPANLMEMLERATNQRFFELQVQDSKFRLVDLNAPRDQVIELGIFFTPENQIALSELTWRVEVKEAELLEAQRRVEIRRAALSKLTVEEKEILGI